MDTASITKVHTRCIQEAKQQRRAARRGQPSTRAYRTVTLINLHTRYPTTSTSTSLETGHTMTTVHEGAHISLHCLPANRQEAYKHRQSRRSKTQCNLQPAEGIPVARALAPSVHDLRDVARDPGGQVQVLAERVHHQRPEVGLRHRLLPRQL